MKRDQEEVDEPHTVDDTEPDESPGTADDTEPDESPGTADDTEPDESPGTADDTEPDESPGTADDTEPDESPGTADDTEPDGDATKQDTVRTRSGDGVSADDTQTTTHNTPTEERREAHSHKPANRGMYAALIATVGAAAFFAGLAVPGLNQDPITMSDLNQAIVFLENKIDSLSDNLQKLEDTVLTDPGSNQPPDSITDDDPVLGDADAPVTIIEFSDFQCPFCARFYSETLPAIKKNYVDTGMVKIVYRDFPLGNHQNAIPAAIASECADDQGRYWEFHDSLFDGVAEWASMDTLAAANQFKTYAADMGLDQDAFNECLDTSRHIDEVNRDRADGEAYGITGTPAFFLGNDQVGYYPISGAKPYAEFQFVIEQILGATR